MFRSIGPFLPVCNFLGVFALTLLNVSAHEINYQTPTDGVSWDVEGDKFYCRLTHSVKTFGRAVFEREAGEVMIFRLESMSPRMMTGQSYLYTRPHPWSDVKAPKLLAKIDTQEGYLPIKLKRTLSERMLAELQKGYKLIFRRQPWYGDSQTIQVTLPSIAFFEPYDRFTACIENLLPVNFKQIEKSRLYYEDEDDELTVVARERLDTILAYAKEDPSIKTFYLDGHTDSQGMREENLIKSQRRTEKVMDYLIENGIERQRIVARWHGERYQVATNRSPQGRARNRRVTVRLSRESPQTLVENVSE